MTYYQQAKALGYVIQRGAYRDVPDDRLDRWYWRQPDGVVPGGLHHRSPEFLTREDAARDALEWHRHFGG